MNNLISLRDWNKEQINNVINLAETIKLNPKDYDKIMVGKSLLMIFEKPSLRTRLSFEAGMTQMGGHAIYYNVGNSPMGTGKESISDSIKASSRFVDIIMARLFKHSDLIEMANYSSVPVINALTDDSHPCQIIADFLSIKEKLNKLDGIKITYFGDGLNNVTHSLMIGGVKMGLHVTVCCPNKKEFIPNDDIIKLCNDYSKNSSGTLKITHDPKIAIEDADVVYTDSWMSYHIPKDQEANRIKELMPYQINQQLMLLAKSDAIFMNCLPATRGYEQSSDVIDGTQSIVFELAENRLHAQKAIMINLLNIL